MRAVLYARVSTGDQAKKGKIDPTEGSCETQFQNCREIAKRLGATVIGEYKDEGISGDANDRPGYQAVLAAANQGDCTLIIANEVSRLWRNKAETWRCVEQMQHRGIRIYTRDGYDSENPTTEYLLAFISVSSAGDITKTSIRTYDELYKMAQAGKLVGGCPYGYNHRDIIDTKHLDRHGRQIVLDTVREKHPEQAWVVHQIFTWFAEGRSTREIATELNTTGVPSPGSTWERTNTGPNAKRCAGWVGSAVYAMLQNEMYHGLYIWNRFKWKKSQPGSSKRTPVERPRSEWIITPRPELAVVDERLWQKAQARISRRKDNNPKLRCGGKPRYLLSGILKCGVCGSNYVLDNNTHYSCTGSHTAICDNKMRLARDLAEELILGPIHRDLLAPEVVDLMVKEMRRYYTQQMEALKEKATARPAELTALDERLGRLRARLKAGDPDMATDELQLAIDRAEGKRQELLSAQPAGRASAKVLAMLPKAADAYRTQIKEGLTGQPREAARARAALKQLVGGQIELHT